MTGEAPTGSNADEWALFLSEWGTAYCAVRIADRIEALEAKLAENQAASGECPTIAYFIGVMDGKSVEVKDLEAKLAKAMEGLHESEAEIDQYIWQEYPYDAQETRRQREYLANPARIAIAELKGEPQ